MTGEQLDLFTSSRPGPWSDDPSTGPNVPLPTDASEQAAPRRDTPHDHAGQLGDDGSLHYMLTGQPEPRRAA